MDAAVARWLVSPAAQPYVSHVRQLRDPSSLRAATELRRRLSPDQAAAVLTLESLRRQGRGKLAGMADRLYLTRDGLEQASRWPVARWRATRLVAAGVTRVIDAGCGIGLDALACAEAGLAVIGLERDEVTAILAQANLPGATILHQAIEQTDVAAWLAEPGSALFLDPARRTTTGRSWDLADLSPAWPTVVDLMSAAAVAVVKLAPGFPYGHLPDEADVTWVSHRRELVETSLWTGPAAAGRRLAVVLPDDFRGGPGQPSGPTASQSSTTPSPQDGWDQASGPTDPGDHVQPIVLAATDSAPPTGPVEAYLYEPDPAVIRARAVGDLAAMIGAHGLADGIAYLSGPRQVATGLAEVFAVLETFGYSEKALRAWVRTNDVGAIDIKVRGLAVDPAELRRRLTLTGKNHTLVILSPTPAGTQAIVARRV